MGSGSKAPAKDEFDVIMGAPRVAAIAFFSAVGVVWFLTNWGFSKQIDGLNEQIKTLNTQMAGRDRRIAELEKKIADDAEMVARALSFYQQSLAEKVKELPIKPDADNAAVHILGDDANPLLQQLNGVFARTGWGVINTPAPETMVQYESILAAAHKLPQASDALSGIYLSVPNTESGRAVRDAFDKAEIPYVLWNDAVPGDAPTIVIRSWDETASWGKLLAPAVP